MTYTQFEGYLDSPYLSEIYGSGLAGEVLGLQVNQIINKEDALGLQAHQIINRIVEAGLQSSGLINAAVAYGLETSMTINVQAGAGLQMTDTINPAPPDTGLQVLQVVLKVSPEGVQASGTIVNKQMVLGLQASQTIAGSLLHGLEAKNDTVGHYSHGKYLVEGEGYLESAYLSELMCAVTRIQARQNISTQTPLGLQAQQVIKDRLKAHGLQALQNIKDHLAPLGLQADQVKTAVHGMQATMVLYNNTQLRIMREFPSRGLDGDTWTATNQATGDFVPNNLNTDILQEVFRSSVTSVTLTCDTQLTNGVAVDTIAILNHNLSGSAVVQVQGSKSGTFSPPDITFNMTVEPKNMYYIAPELPKAPGQNRHWRFIIQDPSNPDGYVQIGVIVFGASRIFTTHENFQNPIKLADKHFKDSIETEGFTNVMNDRALVKTLHLDFKDLDYARHNYEVLDDLVKNARTSLKALIIPRPRTASRFAVFAKLTDTPEPSFTGVDDESDENDEIIYIDLSLDWDESK